MFFSHIDHRPKLFQACCRFVIRRLKKLKQPCKTKETEKVEKAKDAKIHVEIKTKIVTIVDDMPWQVLQVSQLSSSFENDGSLYHDAQSGAEEDEVTILPTSYCVLCS